MSRSGRAGILMGLAPVLSMAGWAFGAEVIVDTAYVARQKDKAGVVVLDARAKVNAALRRLDDLERQVDEIEKAVKPKKAEGR